MSCGFIYLYRPISGGSMNPARTLGPAIATSSYKGIWVYMVGPITGALLGTWSYVVIQETNKQALTTSLKLHHEMKGIELVGDKDNQCSVWE